jgi:hypothetical protein
MGPTSVKVLDDEFNLAAFQTLTPTDITGNGRIRPLAARQFAERAELVQNLTSFYGSAVGADPEIKAHWSTIGVSRMLEEALDITQYKVVSPFIRLHEQADAQRLSQSNQEQVSMEAETPSGLTHDDASIGNAAMTPNG